MGGRADDLALAHSCQSIVVDVDMSLPAIWLGACVSNPHQSGAFCLESRQFSASTEMLRTLIALLFG